MRVCTRIILCKNSSFKVFCCLVTTYVSVKPERAEIHHPVCTATALTQM
jgi:hypothetical protein